ncbi:IS1 family transposase, partial [Escherichia coli]|uniref:IS1 family transposase n=1 Tax=Escherichia coli TaxID=562 RepID=UPI00335A3735
SLSFSKSVELHDKVIGHYLNIKHYQKVGVITQIINEIRINFAKKQLEMTNYSVTDIAFEAGYSSPSLFIKTFKKLTSFTPKSYRKKLTEFNQ